MSVWTDGTGTTIVNESITWTVTTSGFTVLQGTSAEVEVGGVTTTTLTITDRKYGLALGVGIPFEKQMYTEVSAYTFPGPIANFTEGTVLTPVIDTSAPPTAPVGVQLGKRDQIISITGLNSVQSGILNGIVAYRIGG
jgi:hypothetical protein